MVAGIEAAAGDAVGGGRGVVHDGRVDEGRRGVGRRRSRSAFDRRSAPQAAEKLWEASGPASSPPLTSWSMGGGLTEQWGGVEPRRSRTHLGLYGAYGPTFVHVVCMWVEYTNVVFYASQPCM